MWKGKRHKSHFQERTSRCTCHGTTAMRRVASVVLVASASTSADARKLPPMPEGSGRLRATVRDRETYWIVRC